MPAVGENIGRGISAHGTRTRNVALSAAMSLNTIVVSNWELPQSGIVEPRESRSATTTRRSCAGTGAGFGGRNGDTLNQRDIRDHANGDGEHELCAGSIGGPAARRAQDCIKSVSVHEYSELGMEAVWKIDVVDFPAFIVVDDKGNDFFAGIAGGRPEKKLAVRS